MSSVSRRSLLVGLAASPIFATVVGPDVMAQEPLLRSLAKSAAISGRYFGVAARADQLDQEPELRRAVIRDCAYLTPEIHMKWDAIEPREGVFAFDAADALVVFASQHGLKVRGHTLLWEQSTPDWARAALLRDGDWLRVDRHIHQVMGRYGPHVDGWDVVNEPVDVCGGDNLRRTTFYNAFGPGYVERALRNADAAAPGAKLFINDYGFDYENEIEAARREAFLVLLRQLRGSGAPLHGVGVQAHLDLGKGPLKPKTLARFFQEIADLGLDITISELDIKEHDYSLPLAERDRRVAEEVKTYLAVALDQKAVKGVVTWGLTDRHSWLEVPKDAPSTARQPLLNRGLPYDADLAPKPMYWALGDVFVTCRNCG